MAQKFTVSLDIKDMFFDRQRVLDSVRAENRKKLSKAGAHIRTRARSLIGQPVSRRTRPRGPGAPPHARSRSGIASLRYILFGLNSDWESVVIGPVGLTSLRLRGSSASTVPQLMEFGGSATITESLFSSGWVPGAKGKDTQKRSRRAKYPSHPFMGPALDDVARDGTIAGLWGG